MSTVDEDQYLLYLVEQGARKHYGADWAQNRPDVVERLQEELSLIFRKGFGRYFLTLWRIVHECRIRKIPVGPGRGSVGGCLIAYCLGLTEIDSLKYNLLFSRFLTDDRTENPDIDMDFTQERRPEVLDMIRELFGAERTIQIGAFQRFGWKATINIIGAIAGMTHDEIAHLRGLVPEHILGGRKIQRELEFVEQEVTEVREWLAAHPEYREALMAADGGYQHMGRHAAGIIIMDESMRRFFPLASPDGKDLVTAWDMYDVERLNLVKIDILGLRTLDIIETACASAGITPQDIDDDEMPEPVREGFWEGDTYGIFQLQNWGYTKLVRDMQPESFEDIAALNALYRPGCLEAFVWVKDGHIIECDDPSEEPPPGSDIERINMVEVYVRRRHGKLSLTYLHPDLEPILEPTRGIILYQEQAMRISIDLAGFSEGKSDVLRKAIGKKRLEVMNSLKVDFLEGCVANGYERHLAEQIWENIAAAARYSWNKAHSVGYGKVTWRCMWLKRMPGFAESWFAALLNTLDKTEMITQVIAEMKRKGVRLIPPDINDSGRRFQTLGWGVQFGFGGISGFGQSAAKGISDAIAEGGRFTSLEDFFRRCSGVPINVVMSLIAAGAFDRMPGTADGVHTGRGWMLMHAKELKHNTKLKKPRPLSDDEYNEAELMTKEKEALGFFVTQDPFTGLRQRHKHVPSDSLLLGTVTHVRTRNDKNGNEMAWLTVDDPDHGTRRATLFSSIWRNVKDQIDKNSTVALVGRDETWKTNTSFTVERLLEAC